MHHSADRFIVLDGLRGVAALCIVVLHSHRFFGDFELPSAALAVDLFFCLSGFVLAHAYEKRLDQGLTPIEFMKLRLVRLYPLFLVGILLGVVYYLAAAAFPHFEKDFSLTEVALSLPFNLAMLPSPVSATLYPFNGVMWSIFFELVANLVWVLFYQKLKATWVLVALVAVSGVLFVVFAYLFNTVQLGVEKQSFIGGIARVSFSYFAGVLIYRLHRSFAIPRVADLLIVAAAIAAFALPRFLPVELACALLVMPTLVALGSVGVPTKHIARVWSVLGEASYAMYCVHKRGYILLYAALLQFFGFDAELFAPLSGAVYLVLVLAASLVLTRWYDVPMRKALTRLVFKRVRPT